jgi:hypothetical protein
MDPMAQRELTGSRLVLGIERGRWDIRSIKMFRRETGKGFVVVAHGGNVKNLPTCIPAQLGCCRTAPLRPHLVQRADRRSMSLDASGPIG